MPGRKKGNWSSGELERLCVLYPKCPEDRVASMMNRSVESVRRRARELFERPVRRGAWSSDEDHQLRVSYGVLDLPALSLVLARTAPEVEQRIDYLRSIRRRDPWEQGELGLLKQLYGTRSDEDLEVCLSRSRSQIAEVAERLCLSKDKRFLARRPSSSRNGRSAMPRWTIEEERRLVAIYANRDNLEIARLLRRSVASVANKASQLGLRKSRRALREMGRRNVSARYGD